MRVQLRCMPVEEFKRSFDASAAGGLGVGGDMAIGYRQQTELAVSRLAPGDRRGALRLHRLLFRAMRN